MKNLPLKSMTIIPVLVLGLLIPIGSGGSFAQDAKLEPQQLVERHLQALGGKEIISAKSSLVLKGTVRFRTLSGGTGRADLSGESQVVSTGHKINIIMNFGTGSYSGEQFVSDGKSAITAYSSPGIRSGLADFLFTQKFIMSEGVFGGALTTAWPLFDLPGRKPKLNVKGLEKVGDRELWELEYRPPRGGGDVQVRLYFDPETFNHVLTTYDLRHTAQLGARPEDSARQRSTRYKIEERFEEFKTIEGLNLPTKWTIQFAQQGTSRGELQEWAVEFQQAASNQEIPEALFLVK